MREGRRGCQPPQPAARRKIAKRGSAWEKPPMRRRDFDPGKSRHKHGPTGRPDAGRPQRQARNEARDERRDERRGGDKERPRGDKERPRGDKATKPAAPRHDERRERPWRRDKPRPDRADHGERGDHRAFKKKTWRPPARERDRDGPVILYGWHAVKAALENPARRFHRLLATENAAHRLTESGIALPIAPTPASAQDIEALVGPDAVHQGLLAEADPLDSPSLEELTPQGLVLVLDQITDPQNVGAILRSAAAFAVEAVIITARHSPEATGLLAKAASAALEHVPLVTVPNLARAIEVLKDKNVFVIGLDSSGETDLATVPLRAPLALVVGAEGRGLRQLTRTHCDAVARIALPGKIASLNVSNATVLGLFVASGRIAS
jgi:23S rRNA (guanosine2251-2'-O)-methyltransferase